MEERIKQLMESLGMSQQDFAAKIGLSAASISNILTGRSKPTQNHVTAIHRAFPSVNVSWLMFDEGNMLEGSEVGVKNPSAGNVGGSKNSEGSLFDAEENSAGSFTSGYSTPMEKSGGLNSGVKARDNFSGNVHEGQQIKHELGKNPGEQITKIVTETKIVRPRVVEIRVFYDDQTFESFVPSEKRTASR